MTTATAELPRTGSPSRSDDALRYSLLVSKDDRAVAQGRTFAEVLTDAIHLHYDGVDKAFADAAGISSSAVSRYKAGGQVPRPETIAKMAQYMHMTVPRLMSIAYPDSVSAGTNMTAVHPLVMTLNQLIGPDSRMPADERAALEAVITTVLAPYKRHLRARKTG